MPETTASPSHLIHRGRVPNEENGPITGAGSVTTLVEAAGIEPASADAPE
jgi:hypothetical protein